jgi:hypothetical protein
VPLLAAGTRTGRQFVPSTASGKERELRVGIAAVTMITDRLAAQGGDGRRARPAPSSGKPPAGGTGSLSGRGAPRIRLGAGTRERGYGDTFLLRRIPRHIRYTATVREDSGE